MPGLPKHTNRKAAAPAAAKARAKAKPRRRWLRVFLFLVGVPTVALSLLFIYYWFAFSRMLDERFSAEPEAAPRLFARPMVIRDGQALSSRQLIDRLNDLGYAQRTLADTPGEFAIGTDGIVLIPRNEDAPAVRVTFTAGAGTRVQQIEQLRTKAVIDQVTLEAPLITALVSGQREKRRVVKLAQIPQRMIQAVIAIEDRRFYEHPGLDPIGIAGAALSNLRGDRGYLSGGSTITQQFLKNTMLTRDKTPTRKAQEAMLSLVLESRLSKDEILELYLNDVDLGQRGSYTIRGVAEAARLFFGKDVSNVTLAEAATIAGVIQAPSRHSPFRNPENAKERRNVVLGAMADAGFISADAATRAAREPLIVVQRALDAEAPHFVDYVSDLLESKYDGLIHPNCLGLQAGRVGPGIARDARAPVPPLAGCCRTD